MIKVILSILLLLPSVCWAVSDTFPPSEDRPVIADFLSSPNHTYHCDPSGNNSTGDGSSGSPWYDLYGARTGGSGTPAAAGDLILFHEGSYTTSAIEDWTLGSYSRLTANGTSENPIVISNAPGEIATWNNTNHVSFTFSGDYQIFIGTMVGSEYGIQINGGISIDNPADYVQILNIEFESSSIYGTNPGMIVEQNNTYRNVGIKVAHCYFHDMIDPDGAAMGNPVAIRFFNVQDALVEYNLAEDNQEAYQGGGLVYIKDSSEDVTVRYNTVINSNGLIGYVVQEINSYGVNGLDVYGNLVYGNTCFAYFISDLGDSDDINIYNNVALGLTQGFLHYLNADNQSWTEHGDYYDNIIDGSAAYEGWHANSDDLRNLPDLYDYNLWYSSSDRNAPSGWSWPSGYFTHAVTSADCVTYNGTSHTATVADDYAGLGAGRYGGNIGGFTFDGETPEETPASISRATVSRGTVQ